MTDSPLPTAPTATVWFARSTLIVFTFLAVTSQLPAVLDIYGFVLWRVLFIPSYLVTLLFYDAPWGLENVVYAINGVLGGGKLPWEVGSFVTYYLFAVVVTWLGRRLASVRPTGNPD